MIDPQRWPSRYTVHTDKVVDYLLNPDHPKGGSKARFFLAFGFTADRPRELIDALAGHFLNGAPSRMVEPPSKAPRIVFEGPIDSPDGRRPSVRTVWWIDETNTARFVTAVPLTA